MSLQSVGGMHMEPLAYVHMPLIFSAELEVIPLAPRHMLSIRNKGKWQCGRASVVEDGFSEGRSAELRQYPIDPPHRCWQACAVHPLPHHLPPLWLCACRRKRIFWTSRGGGSSAFVPPAAPSSSRVPVTPLKCHVPRPLAGNGISSAAGYQCRSY